MDTRPGGRLAHGDFDKVDVVHLGPWCGVTYKAYIDFVLANQRLEYCTVDADFGCGVILKQPASSDARAMPAFHALRSDREQQLAAAWYALGNDFAGTYAFFERQRETLLHLLSVEAFRAGLAR